ncbi:MAG TPA: hypothetical protein VFW33_10170, partial [Gemmataceae bacterium]|nr:hypothetical protein [Gemmataceae bacterium]
MRRSRIRLLLLASAALWAGGLACGAEPTPAPAEAHGSEGHEGHREGEGHHEGEEHREEPSDLFPCDFFRTGWDEPFEDRPREGRAPRFNLFKSRQGFLERDVVLGYSYTNGLEDGRVNEHEVAGEVQWAFNRRFGVGVESLSTWQRPGSEGGRRADGLRWDFSTRWQLIDTADCAFNFQVHVITPESHLDEHQTGLAFTLAGFEDLTKTLGLYRFGLYQHVEYVSLIGPRGVTGEAGGGGEEGDVARPPEERRPASLLRYDVSVAKTFVDPNVPLVGDLTAFVEAFAETELDGSHSGSTAVTLTPGIRFNPTGREERPWWVQAAVEFPVSGPRAFNERV